MRTTTVVSTLAATGLAGALAVGGVPALASSGDTATSSTASSGATASPNRSPLSDDELATIDQFFTDHPGLGHRFAARVGEWNDFLAAHPDLATELATVRDLPKAQRRAELKSWLDDHPDLCKDLRAMRKDRRAMRHDLRHLRRDLR